MSIESWDSLSGSTCVGTLALGKNCLVKVDFRAANALTTTGTLSFSDSAANTPQTASLSGIGLFLFQGSSSQ